MNQRLVRLYICVVTWLICLSGHARVYEVSEVPNYQLSDSTRLVSDPDNLIGPEAEAQLNNILRSLRSRTSVEMALVAIEDIPSDTDIETFATELFEEWGIGKADNNNGVLMLYVPEQRSVVVRTGRGVEGALPDITIGRIMRETIVPAMKRGDSDQALIDGVQRIDDVLSDPNLGDELRSNASHKSGEEDFFSWYLRLGVVASAILLVVVIFLILSTRSRSELEQYRSLESFRTILLFLTILFIGMPLPAMLLLWLRMRRLRLKPRVCVCGNRMRRLNEQEDNNFLTAGQDAEERLNSIDYDVWLCDHCGNTEVVPYVNKASGYTVCPRCNARTCTLSGSHTVVAPTTMHKGQGVHTYTCRHCGYNYERPYEIAKLPPVVVIPGGGRGGGNFGGFGGGGFGGGHTGGGGATGSW